MDLTLLQLTAPWITIWHFTNHCPCLLELTVPACAAIILFLAVWYCTPLNCHLLFKHQSHQHCSVIFYTTHSCSSVAQRNIVSSGTVHQFLWFHRNHISWQCNFKAGEKESEHASTSRWLIAGSKDKGNHDITPGWLQTIAQGDKGQGTGYNLCKVITHCVDGYTKWYNISFCLTSFLGILNSMRMLHNIFLLTESQATLKLTNNSASIKLIHGGLYLSNFSTTFSNSKQLGSDINGSATCLLLALTLFTPRQFLVWCIRQENS